MEEELAAYVEDEMIDEESNSSVSIDRSVTEDEPGAMPCRISAALALKLRNHYYY